MPRKRILSDEQRKQHKQESNNKPENKEKRKIYSRKYYEKIKLRKYIEEYGNDEGFNYRFLDNQVTQIFLIPIAVNGEPLLEEEEESNIETNNIVSF